VVNRIIKVKQKRSNNQYMKTSLCKRVFLFQLSYLLIIIKENFRKKTSIIKWKIHVKKKNKECIFTNVFPLYLNNVFPLFFSVYTCSRYHNKKNTLHYAICPQERNIINISLNADYVGVDGFPGAEF
jgi:hypothetical protein